MRSVGRVWTEQSIEECLAGFVSVVQECCCAGVYVLLLATAHVIAVLRDARRRWKGYPYSRQKNIWIQIIGRSEETRVRRKEAVRITEVQRAG